MKNYAGKTIKTIRTIAVSVTACALLLLACQNPLSYSAGNNAPGTLFLTFNGAGRTILPSWPGLSAFDHFVLAFTNVSGDGAANFEIDDWDGAAPVDMPTGTWIVEVAAFLPGVDGGQPRETARGSSGNFTVTAGQVVAANIVLRPVPMSEGGYGTFSWNIGFSGITGLDIAEIIITDLDGPAVHDDVLDILPGIESWEGSHSLQAGWYLVAFSLVDGEGESSTISAVLHLYQNLESAFSETFTAAHFPVTPAPSDITISPASLVLTITDAVPNPTAALTAAIQPATADQEVLWSVSAPGVVEVDASTGLVTALGVGSATVIAVSIVNPAVYAEIPVTVQRTQGVFTLTWATFENFAPDVVIPAPSVTHNYLFTGGTVVLEAAPEFSNVRWFLGGTQIATDANNIALNFNFLNQVGTYRITVIADVPVNGIPTPFSRIVSIEVTP